MAQTISNHETQLTTYLVNQAADTLDEIRMIEKSLKVLTEGDTEFAKAVDDVIQSKYDDINALKFRLSWLQSQLTQVKSL